MSRRSSKATSAAEASDASSTLKPAFQSCPMQETEKWLIFHDKHDWFVHSTRTPSSLTNWHRGMQVRREAFWIEAKIDATSTDQTNADSFEPKPLRVGGTTEVRPFSPLIFSRSPSGCLRRPKTLTPSHSHSSERRICRRSSGVRAR